MEISKQLMSKAKITPKLRLGVKTEKGAVSTGPHRVKMVGDKIVMGTDSRTGKEIEMVRYTVEENGETKIYDVKVKNKEGQLNYLVQHLSEIPEGGEVILEMKKSGIKNYISVIPVGGSADVETEEHDFDYGEEEVVIS